MATYKTHKSGNVTTIEWYYRHLWRECHVEVRVYEALEPTQFDITVYATDAKKNTCKVMNSGEPKEWKRYQLVVGLHRLWLRAEGEWLQSVLQQARHDALCASELFDIIQ